MNKSIYEKALEIIDVEFDAWERLEYLELFELVEHALQQAIKYEKLLKQHQKIASAIVRISIEQPIYVIKESESESVEQSFNKIREIENDI